MELPDPTRLPKEQLAEKKEQKKAVMELPEPARKGKGRAAAAMELPEARPHGGEEEGEAEAVIELPEPHKQIRSSRRTAKEGGMELPPDGRTLARPGAGDDACDDGVMFALRPSVKATLELPGASPGPPPPIELPFGGDLERYFSMGAHPGREPLYLCAHFTYVPTSRIYPLYVSMGAHPGRDPLYSYLLMCTVSLCTRFLLDWCASRPTSRTHFTYMPIIILTHFTYPLSLIFFPTSLKSLFLFFARRRGGGARARAARRG